MVSTLKDLKEVLYINLHLSYSATLKDLKEVLQIYLISTRVGCRRLLHNVLLGLDADDYFIMLMIDDDNQHGLLDYTIPKDSALLDLFHYTSIKLCPVFIFEVELTNPADYEHGHFGEIFRYIRVLEINLLKSNGF